jgi:hypothetical protein
LPFRSFDRLNRIDRHLLALSELLIVNALEERRIASGTLTDASTSFNCQTPDCWIIAKVKRGMDDSICSLAFWVRRSATSICSSSPVRSSRSTVIPALVPFRGSSRAQQDRSGLAALIFPAACLGLSIECIYPVGCSHFRQSAASRVRQLVLEMVRHGAK